MFVIFLSLPLASTDAIARYSNDKMWRICFSTSMMVVSQDKQQRGNTKNQSEQKRNEKKNFIIIVHIFVYEHVEQFQCIRLI